MSSSHCQLVSCSTMLAQFDMILAASRHPCPTGVKSLDELFGGGVRDEFVVVGGTPGAGKTDLALNMALSFAAERPVVYVSFELSRKQLLMRLLSCSAAKRSRETALTEQEIWASPGNDTLESRLAWSLDGLASVAGNILFADAAAQAVESDGYLTVKELRSTVAALKSECGVTPAVFVDYLQEFTLGNDFGGTSTDTLDYLSRHLAAMAHTDETPVVALSSLAKDGTFRGSAHIAHAADIALIIGGDDGSMSASKEVDLEVAKNRSGKSGMTLKARYTPSLHLFE